MKKRAMVKALTSGQSMFQIQLIDESTLPQAVAFLQAHEHYSLFLLNNLLRHGFKLTQEPYSGNFYLARLKEKIVAVFCLTLSGTLLVQAEVIHPLFEAICDTCQQEARVVQGLIGDWDFCFPFWNYLKEKKIIQQERFSSKEKLYQIDLAKRTYHPQSQVRKLTKSDYLHWQAKQKPYLQEMHLPDALNEKEQKRDFEYKASKGHIFGLFIENIMVSTAEFNATALHLAQLGGVYTFPEYRKKGYGKKLIEHMLYDAYEQQHLRKLILFTGEENMKAQKLYESLGAEWVGHFSMFF